MNPAGRLVIPALRLDRWSTPEILQRAEEALTLGVGGFILFGGRAADVARLTAELWQAADRPLWFAADLERGAGQQFAGASPLPPPAALAAHPEPEEAVRLAGRLTGREARRLGVNWVLAPVLDLDVEAANPIVSTRSFGADPAAVGRLGAAWIEACQAEGVAACAKHFPGHGRTRADSHLELPIVEASRELLEADLAPFRAAADRAATVMVGHVAYPALGDGSPASLSPAVVSGLLRETLGFAGLVVTDAMIMEGFRAGPGESAAVGAVRAGCDLLLYPRDLEACVRALGRAMDRDTALAERVRAAAERSERRCAALAGADAGWAPPADELQRQVARLADRCLVAPSGEPPAGWRRDLPTVLREWPGIRAAAALPEAAGQPPTAGPPADAARPGAAAPPARFGEAFAEALEATGWTIRRAAAGGAAGETVEQRVALLRVTPRAWTGRAGLDPATVQEVRAYLQKAAAGVAVVYGPRRTLEALAVPGVCAWWDEPLMERAAARWLDRRAS